MTVTVVVGAQWGDEGKGKVTDVLAERAGVVARYQGGNNAGHTVVVGGEEFKFHLLPSGVVHDGKANVIANGVVVDPAVLRRELADLEARGRRPKLFVSDRAHVIVDYHRLLDGAAEARAAPGKAIGTTQRGIGPCYGDKVARSGVRVGDLLDRDRLLDRLAGVVPEKLALLRHYGRAPEGYAAETLLQEPAPYVRALADELAAHGKALAPLVTDTTALLHEAVEGGEDVLLEGAQGTFLDIDHGTYPFVTSSSTSSGGACTGTGLPPTTIDRVVGVVKAYTSRVGAGPFPTELSYESREGKHFTEVGREYGTTTGRRRRTGWLDLVLLRRAARINGFTSLALTKVDVLAGLDRVLVCEAYDLRGRTLREPPSDPVALAEAKPVYHELPAIGAIRPEVVRRAARAGFEALPKAARDYVDAIEKGTGVPVSLVGIGAGREATILR